MQLYWSPNSRAFRALWMLEELGRPYERVLVDLRSGAQAAPEYRRINPMGKVPALRDGPWKFIPAPGSGGWSKGGDRSQPVQLYNLDEDLGETKNLAAAMPGKVAEMEALLDKLIKEGRSTPGARQVNDVKVTRHPSPAAGKRNGK